MSMLGNATHQRLWIDGLIAQAIRTYTDGVNVDVEVCVCVYVYVYVCVCVCICAYVRTYVRAC